MALPLPVHAVPSPSTTCWRRSLGARSCMRACRQGRRIDTGHLATATARGRRRHARGGAARGCRCRTSPSASSSADLPLILQNRERAFSYVRIEGDAEFANAISQLSQGCAGKPSTTCRAGRPIAAVRLAGGARAAVAPPATPAAAWPKTSPNSCSKKPLLVRPQAVAEFGDDVAACATTSSAWPSASPWLEAPPASGPHGTLMILKFLRLLKICGRDQIRPRRNRHVRPEVPRTARLINRCSSGATSPRRAAIRLRMALEELGRSS
jgi:hypothetical protein